MLNKEYAKSLLQYLKEKYPFQEIPNEGGFAYQTYISEDQIVGKGLPDRYSGERSINSAILFLLDNTENCFSAIHQLKTDETYHFYLGDPVELLMLYPDGKSKTVTLGSDIIGGELVQYTVPHGIWQGSHLLPGGTFALMGASMSPGFDERDFKLGKRQELLQTYPDQKNLIEILTR